MDKKFFDKSFLLASMVEEEFVQEGRLSRGVKQRNEKRYLGTTGHCNAKYPGGDRLYHSQAR
jgi:hypothetical protein